MTEAAQLDSRTDSGAAAVLTCACLALLITIGAALGVVAGLVKAHRQAQAAADLAALAGAQTVQLGGDGCAVSAEFAATNGGEQVACQTMGDEVIVQVRVAGPNWLGLSADPTASARAGPG